MVKLSDLVDIRGGGTPSRTVMKYWNGDIPWVTVKDIKDLVIERAEESITSLGLEESSSSYIPAGNIIIPARMALGRVAINATGIAINQDIKALMIREPRKVDVNYLAFFLRSKAEYIISCGKGATVKGITVDVLRNIDVPLPDFSVQQSIVGSILKAENMFKQSQKMECELNTLAQAVFLEMFGDPVCNTKRWPTKTLSQVVSISSGGTPSKSNDSYWQGDFPWVSPKDMKIDYLSDAIDHISDLVFEETNIKKIPAGTILVVVRGMILAHSIPLAMNLCDIAINQDIKALTVCNDDIETEFLFYCLKNQKDHILSKVSTAAHGTKRLDTPDLLGLEIIVPPLDLQYKYVEIMRKNARMVECYKQSSLTNKQLFDSLMQRAFSGKLDLKKVA